MSLFKYALSAIAPVLGGLITNPLAKEIIQKVTQVLTGKTKATDDELIKALQTATPEMIIELKKMENEMTEKSHQFGLELIAADATDRKNARHREEVLAQAGKADWTHRFLALFIWGGFLAVLLFSMISNEKWVEQAVFMLLGALTTVSVSIAGYYFGSSHSSQEKNKFLQPNGQMDR